MARLSLYIWALISVVASSTFSPARPPAIPLAVRSPYLSAWAPAGRNGGNGGYLAGQWPMFWSGAALGWCGMIKVDNVNYLWMGKPNSPPPLVQQESFEYTSTRSTFIMNVNGQVTMNVTFLSPVDPINKERQAMPVSYLNVQVASADGKNHSVVLYTDISAEWASGDRGQVVKWNSGVATGRGGSQTGDLAFHKVYREYQVEFGEDHDQAAWGYWYYATANVKGLTWQTGEDDVVRGQFTQHGALTKTADTNFRAINKAYPVYGFSVDMGSVGKTTQETLFTINILQDNCIQFATGSGVEKLPSYWKSFNGDELDAIATFYYDYHNAAKVSANLDAEVAADSQAAGGDEYVAITALAVRQTWGGLQIAGTQKENYIFLKESSSDGNIQTVDVLFPMQPMMLYMNASWMKMLLDPLFISTRRLWPQPFAIHDLGDHYPNATGHPNGNAAYQPLEESGNMLIMSLAYAQRTGDTAYLGQNWDLLNSWANWLVSNDSVVPMWQISSDDFAGPLANQTNLALKGIIGLQAASMIAKMTGHSQESSSWEATAEKWITLWQQLGTASKANPPHTTLTYGDDSTFSLLYNLYADQLVQTNIVPHSVYEMQSTFYPTVEEKYGVPLDTRVDVTQHTKSDWEMFCAAIASKSTMDMFITDLFKFIQDTPTSAPCTDLYVPSTAEFTFNYTFKARPVVGGWFSLLALNHTGLPTGEYISQNPASG